MVRIAGAAVVIVAVAIVEVVLFALVARAIGVAWTLLLVVAGVPVGGWLLRREGARAWRRLQRAVAEGRPPGRAAAEGLVGLVAAVLLVVPGLFTDAVGVLLLVPPVRAAAAGRVRGLAERHVPPLVAGDLFGPRRVRPRRGGQRPPGGGDAAGGGDSPVVEGEIVDDRGRRPEEP